MLIEKVQNLVSTPYFFTPAILSSDIDTAAAARAATDGRARRDGAAADERRAGAG